MILYGTDFSKIELLEDIVDEQFTVDAYDTWINLENDNILDGSETVTSLDGSTTYVRGTDYEIDYENGKIKVLSSGSMDLDDYLIDYTHKAYTWTFSAEDGFEMEFWFEREILAKIKLQSGEIVESTLGWRLHWQARVMEWDAYSLSDFVRLMCSWPSATRRIWLYPRPSYLKRYNGVRYYEVLPPEDFKLDFLGGKWQGVGLTIKLVQKDIDPSLPIHE